MEIKFNGSCTCCSYPENKTITFTIKSKGVLLEMDGKEILMNRIDLIKLGQILGYA
jgi:hypothetical protein